MPNDSRAVGVEPKELQRLFNARVLPRITSGELREFLDNRRHCQPPPEFLPWCTHSEMVAYRELTSPFTLVALAHLYRLPDGSIGASGLPDPKKLNIDGQRYFLKPHRND